MYIPQIPLSIMENTRFTGFVNTIISYYCNNMDEERPMNTITYTSGGPSHANVINSSSRTLSGISGSQDTDSDTEALSDSSLEEEEEGEGEGPWGQFVYTDVDPNNADQLPRRLPRLRRQNACSGVVYPSTPVNDVWSSDEEE